MPRKIFISYRRQDSGANALGIGQYLEHEFGRKNVFIDVDMKAGTKFPEVLEERLAECKVMLVLIGPNWHDATDEHGHRRLDDPDDWVRLEVEHALRRDITVIPVRVNGAELPPKRQLPDDMRGLLDHQSASVSLASFRNDMSGLARDIRSISAATSWKRVAVGAAMGLVTLAGLWIALGSLLPTAIDGFHTLPPSKSSEAARQDDILFGTKPGDLVLYGTVTAGSVTLAHYFMSNSVKITGDRIAYEARYAVQPTTTTQDAPQLSKQAIFEDVVNVIDCKKSTAALAQRIAYGTGGEAIARFKWGESENLDLAGGSPIAPGSVLANGQRFVLQWRTEITLAS